MYFNHCDVFENKEKGKKRRNENLGKKRKPEATFLLVASEYSQFSRPGEQAVAPILISILS